MTIDDQSIIRRKQVSDFRASRKTAVIWCAENNLKVSTLRYWINKCNYEHKTNSQQETFIELKPRVAKEVPIVIKSGAFSIELYSGFQAETLREALAAIRTL